MIELLKKILDPIGQSMTVGAVLGAYFIIYEINCVLVCIRLEMAMNFGFHGVESMLVICRE